LDAEREREFDYAQAVALVVADAYAKIARGDRNIQDQAIAIAAGLRGS
jgi:hypothetical protein